MRKTNGRPKRQRLTEREKWQRYEQFKQSLQRRELSPQEYEREIQRYCAKHKL
jgi:hypothetical protein